MKPQFIAEVSSNHHQDLERCFAFIDKAAEIGCDAVKFQLFKIDELFAPQVLAKSKMHRDRRAWELDPLHIPALASHCAARKIRFSCTPFYLDAVGILAPYVDFFKIASYELLWGDLLKACEKTGKPVVLSTGMADLDEVCQAVDSFSGTIPALLHCSSAYPTSPENANLAAIETLRRETGCTVGWSDHTRSPAVIYRAIHRWGARVVEFHLDLDGKGPEYEAGHCWLPHEMEEVIRNVRAGFAADGDGRKEPNEEEMADCMWRADPEDGLRPLKAIRASLEF